MHIQQDKKYTSLQILRALAAWTVVYHHYMQLYFGFEADTYIGNFFSKYGNLGVDIFFVLSGFVMYFASRNTKKSARAFIIDRVFRIAPIYWFYTLVIIICIFLMPKEFGYTDYNIKTLTASLLFLPHWNHSGLGYFPILTVGWTLNFEMFFYACLALCMGLTRKYFFPLLCVGFVCLPLLYPRDVIYSTVASSFMLYEFLAGLLLAVMFASKSGDFFTKKFPRSALLLGAAAVTSSAIILVLYHAKFPFAVSIVLLALVAERFIDRRSAWAKILARLGDESYSTYLAHVVVIGIAMHLTGKNLSQTEQLLTVFSITLGIWVVSKISYRCIERNEYLDGLRQGLIIRIGLQTKPASITAVTDTVFSAGGDESSLPLLEPEKVEVRDFGAEATSFNSRN